MGRSLLGPQQPENLCPLSSCFGFCLTLNDCFLLCFTYWGAYCHSPTRGPSKWTSQRGEMTQTMYAHVNKWIFKMYFMPSPCPWLRLIFLPFTPFSQLFQLFWGEAVLTGVWTQGLITKWTDIPYNGFFSLKKERNSDTWVNMDEPQQNKPTKSQILRDSIYMRYLEE
jgi:hypothetical protein